MTAQHGGKEPKHTKNQIHSVITVPIKTHRLLRSVLYVITSFRDHYSLSLRRMIQTYEPHAAHVINVSDRLNVMQAVLIVLSYYGGVGSFFRTQHILTAFLSNFTHANVYWGRGV